MQHDLFEVAIGALTAVSTLRNTLVNRIVPDPYLDEVFHIPQAQSYCRDSFDTYDPKLTTPPGLYLLSYPLSLLLGPQNGCSTAALRAVNLVGSTIVLPMVCYRVRQRLVGNGNAAHTAVNCALFPLLWFFGGLYYTDVWAAVFVMLGWLGALKGGMKGYCVSAVMLWVSLWFRQTNVVWCAFVMGVVGIRELGVRDPNLQDITASDVLNLPLNVLTAAFSDPLRLLRPLAPYLLVLLSFAAFIVHNNFTIVLGDASAHVASLHLPQLLYFSAATAFFSWPLLLHVIPAFTNSRTWTWFLAPATVVLPAMAAMVKYNTVLHPYLIADNRHFAFYVFRKFLLRWRWALLSVVPVYYAAWWAVIAVLAKSRASSSSSATAAKESEGESGASDVKKQSIATSIVQQSRTPAPAIATLSTTLLWLVSSTLILVTAPLVEPRYFIIAWLVWRLQLAAPAQSWKWQLWIETLWFVAVNIGTTYIFLKWGFEWENEKGKVQRFMW